MLKCFSPDKINPFMVLSSLAKTVEVVTPRAHKMFCLAEHNDRGRRDVWFVFTFRAQGGDCSLSFLTRCLFLFPLSLCFPMNKYLYFRGNVSVTYFRQDKQHVHFPSFYYEKAVLLTGGINRFPRDAWEGVILAGNPS